MHVGRQAIVGLWLLLAATSARAAEGDAPITVVVRGGEPARASVAKAIEATDDLELQMQLRNLPNQPALEEGDFSALEASLAAARSNYINADFTACARSLEGDERVAGLLAGGRRDLAARLLFWRAACLVGSGARDRAAEPIEQLAILGLRTPADVEAATPEVEEVLVKARRRVQERPRVLLKVTAPGAGRARVLIDGRDRRCLSPCSIPVAPGEHLVAIEADGYVAEPRMVRASGQRSSVVMDVQPAGPELSAAQWTRRYAAANEADSPASLELLSRATRSRRVLLVEVQVRGEQIRYRGALMIDGEVVARGERRGSGSGDELAEGLIRDLFSQLRVAGEDTPLYRRPGFWIGLGVAAVAAAGVTAILARDSDRRTTVTF